ncbi:unnamed protein product [Brassica napus]|uniref:(rape) hypothetical protein n=1 Tax=Brassica napus TaxID=3708 RepID=A0A816KMG5_BRANA|nr:unnamed protein product [Brassica napus]
MEIPHQLSKAPPQLSIASTYWFEVKVCDDGAALKLVGGQAPLVMNEMRDTYNQ